MRSSGGGPALEVSHGRSGHRGGHDDVGRGQPGRAGRGAACPCTAGRRRSVDQRGGPAHRARGRAVEPGIRRRLRPGRRGAGRARGRARRWPRSTQPTLQTLAALGGQVSAPVGGPAAPAAVKANAMAANTPITPMAPRPGEVTAGLIETGSSTTGATFQGTCRAYGSASRLVRWRLEALRAPSPRASPDERGRDCRPR